MVSAYTQFQNYVGSIGGTLGSLWGILTNPKPPEDTSAIYLDGVPMPGIVQDEDLSQEIDWEEVSIEGRSGVVRLYHGFKPSTLAYVVTCTNDDLPESAVEKVGQLLSGDLAAVFEEFTVGDSPYMSAIYRALIWVAYSRAFDDAVTHPRVFKLGQEMATAFDVTRVQFQGIRARRTSRLDTIELQVRFVEYDPATVLYESGSQPPPPPTTPEPDTTDPF